MKLYVGNIPYNASESEFQEWLTEQGAVVDSFSIIRDRFSGESRGFGFAEVEDEDQATVAMQLCDGKEFMGRRIVMNEARPPSGNRGGGGDRGRGGGGRGRGGGGRRESRW